MPSDEKSNRQSVNTKIESYYTGSDTCRMWQGLQTIKDYKINHSRELPSDMSLPDKLNYFYARFKENNTETYMREPAVLEDCVMMLSAADVSKTLNRSTFTRPLGKTDYQDMYSKHALTN